MHIYRCEFELMENLFFASREVNNFFQTEPVIGNYALAYALGLCHSSYHNDGDITYATDLERLNEASIYVYARYVDGESSLHGGSIQRTFRLVLVSDGTERDFGQSRAYLQSTIESASSELPTDRQTQTPVSRQPGRFLCNKPRGISGSALHPTRKIYEQSEDFRKETTLS